MPCIESFASSLKTHEWVLVKVNRQALYRGESIKPTILGILHNNFTICRPVFIYTMKKKNDDDDEDI